MKIKKYNESEVFELEYEISKMFFEKCDNFGSEDSIKVSDIFIFKFLFTMIEEEEFVQISKCKEFIGDLYDFYLKSDDKKHNNYSNVKLIIKLKTNQFVKLKHKIEVINNTKKYNV